MSEMLDSLFNRVGRERPARLCRVLVSLGCRLAKKRQAIIDGWTACEQALQQIDAYETDPDATIEALKKSKKFDPDKVAYGSTTWRDLLFPTS